MKVVCAKCSKELGLAEVQPGTLVKSLCADCGQSMDMSVVDPLIEGLQSIRTRLLEVVTQIENGENPIRPAFCNGYTLLGCYAPSIRELISDIIE